MTMTMLNFDEIKRRLEESRAKPLLERTQFTEAAHRNAIASVRAAKASGEIHTPVEMASDEGALWVFANGYLTENRGQPCATRGLQGAHPDWIALLRDLGVPVRIVFWQPPSWWQEIGRAHV